MPYACFVGPSKKFPPRLIDETVIPPAEVIQGGVELLKDSLESFLKKNEEAQAEKEPEGVTHTDSSDADDESSETKSKIGVGKVQLKKKPQKKKKVSDEEDDTYFPTPQVEKKKGVLKRKAVQSGVIPRSVREMKEGATMPEFQSGKSEKHVVISKGPEAVKDENVEVPKVQQVKSVEKKVCGDDKVVIIDERVPTPPPPPPEKPDDAESSKSRNTTLPDPFEGFPNV
ncbi:hypothetical protein Hanom_Chr13g01209371 [Helianthus anomalus]